MLVRLIPQLGNLFPENKFGRASVIPHCRCMVFYFMILDTKMVESRKDEKFIKLSFEGNKWTTIIIDRP